ncbi:hypothetical protein RN001_012598 [Aquatica leii]|uniref:WD repeat-containing protein on Y chromosome n=1 Tax=Aquatica leii TaxID=1421715 RepID=A0AAN7P6F0_9COLE|nr:hypothetical protein RN001_012598 [Aquatica leii]
MCRDGWVTWDEFVSHLILGFQEKEVSREFQSLDLPISKLPRIIRSNHRHPINRITFVPTIKNDGSHNHIDGNYLSVCKDGSINYWTLDLKLDRSVQSTCPELKVQTTWILDVACLPDVSIICTSSSERDLRFYDTSARKFELRIMITSLDEAVVCMHYEFNTDEPEESQLIMGDMSGSVKILLFCPIGRGPFKSQPGTPLLYVRYEKVIRGLVPGFRIIEFKNLHTDWVRQVSYYKNLHCFVSCSVCLKAAMHIKDVSENKISYVYKIPKGAWCFDIAETAHVIATGGPDSLVRIWNPFVPSKPSAIFSGHHTGVCNLIFQDSGKKLFSISKDKCIKVWDVLAQVCVQTYVDVPNELGEHNDFVVFYNPDNRHLLMGSMAIVILELCPLLSGEHTDGTTHSRGVSVVLYNSLFKVVLTCGLDSFIIVWNPWSGRRMSVVRDAHTRLVHGESIPVEITAATFDPGNQLLLTGASNGSLKIWNFNTGSCLRNMSIESECEITAVLWITGRILAIGWNRHVTEFPDGGGGASSGGASSKSWDTRHSEDVLCATARVPQALVTSSYNGELIMWRLETGQPYKRYNVANPTGRIKIQYKKDEKKRGASVPTPSSRTSKGSRTASVFSKKSMVGTKSTKVSHTPVGISLGSPEARARKLSTVNIPETCVPLRGLAIHSMIFLSGRPMMPGVATLLVAVENGTIQVWSHHPGSGFLTAFQVVHTAGDYVISMATDNENEFLFTGTTAGYIKVWLMTDYYPPTPTKACIPKYRLQFPFMWKDAIDGRAKRANRGQPKPVLLSSYKAHMLPVSTLIYLDDAQILISGSADCTCRLWTRGGRYLGTLGTFKPWIPIQVDTPPGEDHPYPIPTDIKRIASSSTLKRVSAEDEGKTTVRVDITKANVYGKRLDEPILGNYFKLPDRDTGRYEFSLDTTFAYIPVYQHLIMPPPKVLPRPRTPESIAALRLKKEEMQKLATRSSRISMRPP